jgi:hypothetical protein
MLKATEQQSFNGRKCLGVGEPKGAGKTTFYLTAPQPSLVFQFDLGSVTVPPGVDSSQVYVQDYVDYEGVDLAGKTMKRKRELGDRLAKDIVCLLDSYKSNKDIVTLSDGTTCPKPGSILLDGAARMDDILVDLLCVINGIDNPTSMPDKMGNAGRGTMRFYGDRLNRLKTLFTMVIGLPIPVNMTAWADIKVKRDVQGNEVSKTIEPNLGGQLNVIGPGYFDSCIYHYYEAGKYLVRTKPIPEFSKIGIRNCYNLPAVIDVTIDSTKALPYQRVFGKLDNH